MQLEHDTAHRITLGVLRLVAVRFDDEELTALYRNTMPIVVAAIHDFRERRDRRLARLYHRAIEVRPPSPASSQSPDGPCTD